MLDLTPEERKVMLFLLAVAVAGAGVKFALKSRNPASEFLKIDNADIKLDLNSAGLAEILRTKALPRKLAENVLVFRRDHGPFNSLKEVKGVKGIGKFRYEKMKEFFFVE